MINSDLGVRIVFVHGHDSDLNSIFAVQITGRDFQYRSNLGTNLLVAMLLRLLAECTHDRPLRGIVRILQCLSS